MSTDNAPAPAETPAATPSTTHEASSPMETPKTVSGIVDKYRSELDATQQNQPAVEADNKPKVESPAPAETKDDESSNEDEYSETDSDKERKRKAFARRQRHKKQIEEAHKQAATYQHKLLEQTKTLKALEAKLERQQEEYQQLANLLSSGSVDTNALYQIGLENELNANRQEQELNQQLAQWEQEQRKLIEQETRQRAQAALKAEAQERVKEELARETEAALAAYPNVPRELLYTFAAKDPSRPLEEVAKDIWENHMLAKTEQAVLEKHRSALSAPTPMRPSGTIPRSNKPSSVADIVDHYRQFV